MIQLWPGSSQINHHAFGRGKGREGKHRSGLRSAIDAPDEGARQDGNCQANDHGIPEDAPPLDAIGAGHPRQQVIEAVLFVFASEHRNRVRASPVAEQLSCFGPDS